MIARSAWYPEVDDELSRLLAAEGLELVGVCDTAPDRGAESEYATWLERGHHGEMRYLERHARLKYDPQEFFTGARSVVFAAINYYQKVPSSRSSEGGRIARYAWGRDYHKELGKRLKRVARRLSERYPDERFRAWTDATPLAERYYAERAGIGFTGRNTLLISAQYGSWFVLGEILSTKRYRPSGESRGRHGACPGNCRRCIDVCPTGALYAPHRIDASRCISYLTIEYDGVIPEGLRPGMGDWLFGCDLCQEVCPLNVRARVTDVRGFVTPIAGSRLELAEVLAIRDDEEFTTRFAGSPLMRAKRRRLVRNACIAAANVGARFAISRLSELARDEDEIIAEHAAWAERRLREPDDHTGLGDTDK